MSRYRFMLRPGWVVSHLFVLGLVSIMIFAGFWQLDRLDQRRDQNRRLADRTAEAVVPVESLVEVGDWDAAGDLEYRRVTAVGRYRPDQEVLVRGRTQGGAPGSWVLTPLQLDEGLSVVINRGWIHNQGDIVEVPDRHRAPEGPVTVTGLIRPTETRGSFGAIDPEEGTLTDLARADVGRLDAQVPEDLLPLYVQMENQVPPLGQAAPEPVPLPSLDDEGPHFSYAVQWFIFTTIAVVGYPLILRRRARDGAASGVPVESVTGSVQAPL